MPSIERRTFLGSLSAGVVAGLGGCSSSCPDSEVPTPTTTFGPGETGRGFETLPDGSWPAPRFDAANSGYAPSRRVPRTPALHWRHRLPAPSVDAGAAVSAPTVADGRVYVTTRAGAFGLSLADGRPLWQTTSLTPVASGAAGSGGGVVPPVVTGDAAFVATEDGVAALDPSDGTVRWRAGDGASSGTPVVADDAVFVPEDAELLALDVVDGGRRWTAPVGDARRLAAADGTVVVAGEQLVGLDAATGERRWTSPVRPASHPAVADGTVHVGVDAGVAGVSIADGRERWTVDRGGGRTYSTPVVTPETVYAVERPGEAGDATFALDRTGDGRPDPRWCSYVGSGAVTAATSGHALALQTGGGEHRPPTRLLAFTRRFGEARWGYRNAEPAVPPAVLDGGIVTATRRGTVVAVGGD
jgi:outer membrane protein assembly factor BamB